MDRAPESFFAEYGTTEKFGPSPAGTEKPSGSQRCLRISASSWRESEIEPRRWVAPGYVMQGAITLIVGQPGISKSTIALAWAVALVLNRPFHKFRPSQSHAVAIYGIEDDDDEQRRRLSAILRTYAATPADIEGQLFRIGPENIGTLLTRDPETREIRLTPAFEELEQIVLDHGIKVLFLDPLAEMHDLDENDNSALRVVMATIRAMAKRRNISVVITHHTRKGLTIAGDPDSARGASSIIGAARVVFTIAGMSDDEAKAYGITLEAKRHFFRLDGAKANYSAAGSPEWFQRSTVALDNGDSVSVPSAWQPPADRLTPEIEATIGAAVAGGSALGPWSPQLTNDARSIKRLMVDYGVTTAPGQKDLLARLEAAGFQRARFYRPANGDWPVGLRSPDGQPHAARWETEDEAADRASKAKPPAKSR